MVILFGHMSKCDRLPREVALEDVWMALDMLPSFRWRWERKDLKGGHPLITRLAEEVLQVNLHQVAPASAPMLLSEEDWDTEGALSPKTGNGGLQQVGPQPVTPTMGAPPYGIYQNGAANPGTQQVKSSPGKTNKLLLPPGQPPQTQPQGDKKLPDVPPQLFYPFYPDQNAPGHTSTAPELQRAIAGGQPLGGYGYQSSEGAFILEEKDATMTSASGIPPWMSSVSTYHPAS
ncbi:hypothetical protein NLI96_g11674 [Meripilus lineatus]|uniref:Uncharacterized protein n=1 Tax=Meripilus lineatus TaxID=2056292 RepID=A0AAD5URI0_9APHY|nr:hypothetical protein NLI96_g11674 [Physisporinus lineatus]